MPSITDAASRGRSDVDERPTTVVVPTRDRPSALDVCLEALSRQTIRDTLEVVVVDDGSQDERHVTKIVGRYEHVRLVRIPAAGPSVARNVGVSAALGRHVLFTDDDCRPEPEWAERLVQALNDGADAVAGATINGDGDNPFAEASQIIANALVVPIVEQSRRVSFAPSNNLGCRIEVARTISFDASFQSPGGEDRDWCARLVRAGYVLQLEPKGVVLHFQRLRLGSFWRQQLRYGRGAYRFRRQSGTRIPIERPAFYASLLRRGAERGLRVGLLVAAAQLATAAGFVLEAGRPAGR